MALMKEFGEEYIMHIGTSPASGRYPRGSGEDPYQSSRKGGNVVFMSRYHELVKSGMGEKDIAKAMGMTINELRNRRAYERTSEEITKRNRALELKDKGWSNVAIAKRMGVTEGSVRNWLKPVEESRKDIIYSVSSNLKNNLKTKQLIDIGAGIENHLGVSRSKLNNAIQKLVDEEGYSVHNVYIRQINSNNETTVKVLAPPGMTKSDVYKNRFNIGLPFDYYTDDGGRTWRGIVDPKRVDPKRVEVNYAETGGITKDGVIELRRGVEDLSLGSARYAQVRIAVGDNHFIKGMAMYSDNLPDGIDILFNTNKHDTGNKLDAMKKNKEDPDNQFGATIRQRHYIDSNGKEQLSALNLVASGDEVNEEGRWSRWSKNLASQFLSKQSPKLAEKQLELALNMRKADMDDILSLTNPTIKKKLLLEFADETDSAAVDLKAAPMARQTTSVILPINSLKPTEIYAPNYSDGERICLIRYPHGGTFEIPELVVNNKNKEAKNVIPNARDAVGIHYTTAQQLSGADFDGDSVIVIPNNNRSIKADKVRRELADFDPKEKYKYADFKGEKDKRYMKDQTKGIEMGKVSNLITDMTLQGADINEVIRAVRHSMVVIDAQKHGLDYKQSYIDNRIRELSIKYQGSAQGGAATIISRSGHEIKIPDRKKSYLPNKETGEYDYKESGKKTWVRESVKTVVNKKTGEVTSVITPGHQVSKIEKVTLMGITKDPFSLTRDRNNPIEAVYAKHAVSLKGMATEARKAAMTLSPIEYSQSAGKTYAKEVEALKAKVEKAKSNSPLERQALIIAKTQLSAKLSENPDMSKEDKKKLKNSVMDEARRRIGAKKELVSITDSEWEAIQSGAVRSTLLESILSNTDVDKLKQRALPKTEFGLSTSDMLRARSMIKNGYTQAEVANKLGVSASTLTKILSKS